MPPSVLETIVRSAAGVFDSAAASIALLDRDDGDLVYESSWGTGAEEIVGVRLPPGTGIAAAVLAAGEPEAIAELRATTRASPARSPRARATSPTRCSCCRW